MAGASLSAIRARCALCVCNFMYVCMYVCMHVCMYGWMDGWMYVCPQCCSQLIALQVCSFCTPVFQIVIQGKHVHNHFLALSFTTSSPFPLSFPLFLHIPFLNFAFHLNSVSEGNWEHVGLSGPIILMILAWQVRVELPRSWVSECDHLPLPCVCFVFENPPG